MVPEVLPLDARNGTCFLDGSASTADAFVDGEPSSLVVEDRVLLRGLQSEDTVTVTGVTTLTTANASTTCRETTTVDLATQTTTMTADLSSLELNLPSQSPSVQSPSSQSLPIPILPSPGYPDYNPGGTEGFDLTNPLRSASVREPVVDRGGVMALIVRIRSGNHGSGYGKRDGVGNGNESRDGDGDVPGDCVWGAGCFSTSWITWRDGKWDKS